MRLRSWSVMPSKESISNITISEASTVFKVLIIPITSRKLLLVLLFLLTPGVSTILKSYPNFLIGILIGIDIWDNVNNVFKAAFNREPEDKSLKTYPLIFRIIIQ